MPQLIAYGLLLCAMERGTSLRIKITRTFSLRKFGEVITVYDRKALG